MKAMSEEMSPEEAERAWPFPLRDILPVLSLPLEPLTVGFSSLMS